MRTLLAVLDPRHTVPRFPTQLCRPWTVLYRRHRRNRLMFMGGGGFIAAVAFIGVFLLLWRVLVLTYGTIAWLMWVYLVASAWLAVVLLSYAGHVCYRLAQLTYRTYEGKHRS